MTKVIISIRPRKKSRKTISQLIKEAVEKCPVQVTIEKPERSEGIDNSGHCDEDIVAADPNALTFCNACQEQVPVHRLHFCSSTGKLTDHHGETHDLVSAGVRPYPE